MEPDNLPPKKRRKVNEIDITPLEDHVPSVYQKMLSYEDFEYIEIGHIGDNIEEFNEEFTKELLDT